MPRKSTRVKVKKSEKTDEIMEIFGNILKKDEEIQEKYGIDHRGLAFDILEEILAERKDSKTIVNNILEKRPRLIEEDVKKIVNNVLSFFKKLGILEKGKGRGYKVPESYTSVIRYWKAAGGLTMEIIRELRKLANKYNMETRVAFHDFLKLSKLHEKDSGPLNNIMKYLLEAMGFKEVRIVDKKGDEGIDIIATWEDEIGGKVKYGVQNKLWPSQERVSKNVFEDIFGKLVKYKSKANREKIEKFIVAIITKNVSEEEEANIEKIFNEVKSEWEDETVRNTILLTFSKIYEILLRKSQDNPNSPLKRFQISIGDEVIYFDLFLPEKAKKIFQSE